tara:strand:+ start:252 stop:1004 length:753 start_codon:yes stop_codon:yes gene_type:complete
MNQNLVSIITPSYNSERFISDTINSVIEQTYDNWELIIVDDASYDQTPKIIKRFLSKESRIKAIFLKENIGPSEARNQAIRIAKGRFIAFLDSDDLWLPNKLDAQINYMITNSVGFSFTSYIQISEDGLNHLKEIHAPARINYNSYLKNTIIGCLTVVLDKRIVGDFEMPKIRSSHDMALWLMILKQGFVAHGIDITLAKYRLVSTSNTANKLKSMYDVWRVYRDFEKLNLIFSLYNFINYIYNAIKKRL